MQRDGVVDSDGEAADYLNSLIGIGDITGGEHMANMEKARGLRLPNEFYDTGVDNYLQFLTRFADRAAQVHSFGQTTDTDVDAFGAAIKAASGDKELRDYLQAVANEIYRRRPIVTGMDRGFEYAVNLTGITYLSGMFTGVRDFMSGVMLANEQFGFLATAVPTLKAMQGSVKSIIGTLKKLEAKDYIDFDKNAETSEMVAAAEAIGAIREDFLQAQLIDQRLDPNREIDRRIGAFGNKALFFKQSMDRLARAVTMGASLNWLRGARNQYAKNSNSWGSRKRVAALKRMRFTDEEAAAMLSGDRALDDEFARRSVAEKQYTYSIAQHPLFVGGKNPVYKLMFQFQRWTFQRGRDLLRNVVIPTANAFRKNQTFDPAPLLRFAGAGILFGELLKWLALFFTDKESRDPTLEEIVNSDDSAMKALERIKNNFVFTGATGFFGDYGMMIAEQAGLDRGPRWKDPFGPPLFNLAEDTIGAGRGFIEKGATLQALGQELEGFVRGIPPIQQGMGVIKGGPIRRAMGIQTFETYEARRDLIRTRVLARRYGQDSGLDVESRFQGVFKADKFSAGKTALKDALLTGDIEAAVEAKTDLLEKGLSLKSIKATVRSGQPVRIGMQTKDDVQKDFMRWMYKTNPSEVDRVQRVQSRYNYTARAIGL